MSGLAGGEEGGSGEEEREDIEDDIESSEARQDWLTVFQL